MPCRFTTNTKDRRIRPIRVGLSMSLLNDWIADLARHLLDQDNISRMRDPGGLVLLLPR
jgi:hypothetical protein